MKWHVRMKRDNRCFLFITQKMQINITYTYKMKLATGSPHPIVHQNLGHSPAQIINASDFFPAPTVKPANPFTYFWLLWRFILR